MKVDIYGANDRFPIDTGECFTKKEIDEMFSLDFPAGTKMICYDEYDDGKGCWYTEDGDGGWNDFWESSVVKNIEITKKRKVK